MEEATLGKRKTRKGYSSILQETGIFLLENLTRIRCVIIFLVNIRKREEQKEYFAPLLGPVFLARANLSRENAIISCRTQIACTNYHVNRVQP